MAKIRVGNGRLMSNSFELFLDTTGPEISIFAPNYTMKNSMTDIEIKGSERLAEDQDFYFIDSQGGRHDVIFQHNGDSFLGWVDFSVFPQGIAILYAQVHDTVFNPSPSISHTILIHGGTGVDVEVEDIDRDMETGADNRFIVIEYKAKPIYEVEISRAIKPDEKVRPIGVGEDE